MAKPHRFKNRCHPAGSSGTPQVRDELPGIAERAGVDLILSKWAITFHAADAQFVDVTDLMVEPFKPSERTKRVIRDLRDHPPVPQEELKGHQH